MEILEIQMKHFGKFTCQNMSFHSGVNVIYGENETGKSTMHAFIRGMLYGIDKQRGRASKNEEYSLRRPWEGGGCFEGSMRFESGGKIYRLDRNFDKKEKKVRLFCESDGCELDAKGESMDALMAGLSESAFRNTVFISQKSGETDEGLAIAVKNFMVNAQSGGFPEVDVKKAMEQLQKERRELEKRKKQELAEQIEKNQEIRMRMDYVSQELEQLKEEGRQYREKLDRLDELAMEQGMDERDGYPLRGKKSGKVWRIGKIAMAVLAVAALMVALVTGRWEAKVICAGIILLACLGVWGFNRIENRKVEEKREGKQRLDAEAPGKTADTREREEAAERQKLLFNLEWVQEARKEKERTLQELEEQYQEFKRSAQNTSELEASLSAVYLAIDTLEEVTAEIYEEFARKLNERVSKIMAQITGGRYVSLYLDECLQVKINTPQRILELEQVSRGTMEQVYFALRMAAAELLCQGEPMPILLDDAFSMYDNTRLEHTLRWLCSCGHQVLLFTCQKREQELLQKIYAE